MEGGSAAKATSFSPLVPSVARRWVGRESEEAADTVELGPPFWPRSGGCRLRFEKVEDRFAHRKNGACTGPACGTLPAFRESFSGPHAPLSEAASQFVDVDVLVDVLRSDSDGCLVAKDKLFSELAAPHLRWRHWAPDCRLFSRTG